MDTASFWNLLQTMINEINELKAQLEKHESGCEINWENNQRNLEQLKHDIAELKRDTSISIAELKRDTSVAMADLSRNTDAKLDDLRHDFNIIVGHLTENLVDIKDSFKDVKRILIMCGIGILAFLGQTLILEIL